MSYWFERVTFVGLVLAALILLALGQRGLPLADRTTQQARDVLTPVAALVAEPTRALRNVVGWLGDQFALAEENRRLRAEVEELLRWQGEATRLQVENAALRDVLHAQRRRPVPIASTARVVAESRSPFVHTRLLDAGRRDGVREGMAAVGLGGLAGRVVDVGNASSRLLLLTDFNSKVPVLVLPSRDPALMVGDNGPRPRLEFLPLTPSVSVGDRVITSGTGGVLPMGLTVGYVAAITDEGVRVQPALDWRDLEHVRLVRMQPPEDLVAADTRLPRSLPAMSHVGR
ncbi:MAG: rod shape-determining protein MreC [Pseudomonadota bacterium]